MQDLRRIQHELKSYSERGKLLSKGI